MIAIIAPGCVVRAGLFVGSSAVILAAGAAVLLRYALAVIIVFLIMPMLGQMATARPGLGSFQAHIRAGLGGDRRHRLGLVRDGAPRSAHSRMAGAFSIGCVVPARRSDRGIGLALRKPRRT